MGRDTGDFDMRLILTRKVLLYAGYVPGSGYRYCIRRGNAGKR